MLRAAPVTFPKSLALPLPVPLLKASVPPLTLTLPVKVLVLLDSVIVPVLPLSSDNVPVPLMRLATAWLPVRSNVSTPVVRHIARPEAASAPAPADLQRSGAIVVALA